MPPDLEEVFLEQDRLLGRKFLESVYGCVPVPVRWLVHEVEVEAPGR